MAPPGAGIRPASSSHTLQRSLGIALLSFRWRSPSTLSPPMAGGKPRSLDDPPRGSYHSISQLLGRRPAAGPRLRRPGAPPSSDDEVFAAVLEGLKARLDQLLRDGSRSDARAYADGLKEALLEARLGVTTMREALAATERELAVERQQFEDAERRGKLAAMVPDAETVQIAERYAVRHRERAGVLERKLVIQR